MIGNNACGSRALGYGRTADNVVGLRRRVRRPASRSSGGVAADALSALVDAAPRRTSAPTFGRFTPAGAAATRSSTCCPRTAAARPVPGRLGGHARRWSSRRPCGWCPTSRDRCSWCSATRRWPRPPTRCRRCSPRPRRGWSRARGSTRGSSTWCAAAGGAVPELPRGARLAVRRGRRRDAPAPGRPGGRRVRRARPPRGRPTPPSRPRCGGSARTAPGWPPAACDRRRTPAGRTPRSRRSGSAPGCATSTSCCSEHGLDGVPYGHFGDGCVHVRIDFAVRRRRRAAQVFRDVPHRLRAASCATHGGSLSGEHGDGRARSELLPLMYDDGVAARCSPRSRRSATRDNLLNPGISSTRRRSTPTCGRRGRGSRSDRAPAGPRRRLARRRGAPLHRRRQVRGADDRPA